jgi:hypothetical protein
MTMWVELRTERLGDQARGENHAAARRERRDQLDRLVGSARLRQMRKRLQQKRRKSHGHL